MITKRVRGPAALISELQLLSATIPESVKRALWQYGRLVMNDAQAQVPVDFGFLRGSGYVDDPYTEADKICMELGFTMRYAAAVHEIPEPPMRSKGGRSAHHEHGKWHYLSDPLDAHAPDMLKYIVASVNSMYGGSE